MNNDKLVSIVLSTYNEEKFLKKTISSVLDQDYTNIEILITDDGSTDSTKEILKSYMPDKRFNIVLNEHSGNIGLNLNNGIRRSKGDIIAILGADDYWLKNKLSCQLHYLGKEKLICSNGSVIDSNDKIIHYTVHNYKNKNYIELSDLLQNNCILASSVIGYKYVFINCGLFDEAFGDKSEDYYLWMQIARKYKIFYLNKVLVKYRVHGRNKSLINVENKINLNLRNIDIINEFSPYYPELITYSQKGLSIIYGKLSRLFNSIDDVDNAILYCKTLLVIDKPLISIRVLKYLLYYTILKIKNLLFKIFPKKKIII